MINSTVLTLCLIGTWQYAGFRYEGHDYPIPNPNLIVRFNFQEDSTVHLKYHRTNEPGFCERKGTYTVKDGVLEQRITWVNPDNNSECGQDTDMQLGRESSTAFECSENKMGLKLELKGKELIYKLERVPVALTK